MNESVPAVNHAHGLFDTPDSDSGVSPALSIGDGESSFLLTSFFFLPPFLLFLLFLVEGFTSSTLGDGLLGRATLASGWDSWLSGMFSMFWTTKLHKESNGRHIRHGNTSVQEGETSSWGVGGIMAPSHEINCGIVY